MPLVNNIANRVLRQVNGQVDREELVNWGLTGLLESMDRYVPGGRASFATFAFYRIRGAMLDGIGKIAPLSKRCYRAAREAGDPHAIYRDATEADHIVDPREQMSPEDFAARRQTKEQLRTAIRSLSKEQQELLRQHYFGGKTLKAAGAELGISKSWACRTHAKALRNLRLEMQKTANLAA